MIKELKKLHSKEPACNERSDTDHLKFLIQQKAGDELKFTFIIELNGTKSWTVNSKPSMDPLDQMQADEEKFETNAIHSATSNRPLIESASTAWDTGNYIPIDDLGNVLSEYEASCCLKEGILKFFLQGFTLMGEFVLMRKRDNSWLLIKRHDEFAVYKNYSFAEMEN